jgi:uncharacterized protein YjbI with pentapeptide repeats
MRYWREVLSDDVMRAHRRWLYRGREGDGRLVLEGERLGQATKSGQLWEQALIDSCDFSGARIVYSKFDGIEISDTTFADGSLYNTSFLDAIVEATRFDRADLRLCWYTDTVITDSSFDRSDMRGANFVRAAVTRCSFKEAHLQETQLDCGVFRSCDFRDAALGDLAHGTVFEDCDFRRAGFEGLQLKDTTFTRCRFAGVSGKPTIEGSFEIVDPDFATDEAQVDGSPRSVDELRRQWEHGS